MSRNLQEIIDRVSEKQDHVTQLKRENEFLLALLVDIENRIDKSETLHSNKDVDFQQISVGIKMLRGLLGTAKILDPGMNPGLVR